MPTRKQQMSLTRRDLLRCAPGAAPLAMPGLLLGDAEKDTTAKTTAGAIRGRVENGIFVYRGVPYGMDTARTRFAAPKPAERWEGTRDCFVWAPRTIQPYTPPAPPRTPPAAERQYIEQVPFAPNA
jgi:para-nitrobenzyl esterase